MNGHSVQDLNLVFAAAPVGPLDESAPYLVDLRSPEAADVMPPILDTIADVLPRGTLTVPGRFPVDSVVTFQVPVRNDGTRPLRIDHLAPG